MVSRPVVLGLMLCDYVIVEEGTKKTSLIGAFGGIAVDHFPTRIPPFSLFAVLTDGFGPARVDVVVTRLETDEEVYAFRG